MPRGADVGGHGADGCFPAFAPPLGPRLGAGRLRRTAGRVVDAARQRGAAGAKSPAAMTPGLGGIGAAAAAAAAVADAARSAARMSLSPPASPPAPSLCLRLPLRLPLLLEPLLLPLLPAVVAHMSTRKGHPVRAATPTALRGAPLAFLLGCAAANALPLPAGPPAVSWLALAPTAVSLLLLSSTSTSTSITNSTSRATGSSANSGSTSASRGLAPQLQQLLLPFAVGAAGSVLGAAVAAVLMRGVFGAKQSAGLAAVFAATYVGGSLNYVAVGRAVALSEDLLAAGLAADLCLMFLYFGLLFWRGRAENTCCSHGRRGDNGADGVGDPKGADLPDKLSGATGQVPGLQNSEFSAIAAGSFTFPLDIRVAQSNRSNVVTALQNLFPLALALSLQFGCQTLCSRHAALSQVSAACEVLLVSAVSIALARVPQLRPLLRSAGALSAHSLLIFFGALGTATRFSSIMQAGPAVLCFAFVCLCVHAVVMVLLARFLLRTPVRECLVSSNANVGGSATAAAYAAALGWQELVPGAVLVGALGYAIATPLGIGLEHILGLVLNAM